MKYNLEHILQRLGKSASLTPRESAKISHVVSEYMKIKPMFESRAATSADRPTYFYLLMKKPVAWLVIIGMLVSGGGVSFAAEKSVPGDILYPVKVGVNEEVRSAFAVTPEKKAEWEAARAERRLDEAATLAVSGRLDETKRKDIETRFEKHAVRAAEDAETLGEINTSAAVDFAANFETRLAAHEALLNEVNESGKLLGPSIRGQVKAIAAVRIRAEGKFAASGVFLESVPQAALKAAQAPSMTSLQAITPDDEHQEARPVERVSEIPRSESGEGETVNKQNPEIVDRARAVSEKVLADAIAKFADKSSRLSDVDKNAGTEMIARARHLFAEADDVLEGGDETRALVLFRESLALSQKLIIFLKASLNLDIRIIAPVDEESNSDEDSAEHIPSLKIR